MEHMLLNITKVVDRSHIISYIPKLFGSAVVIAFGLLLYYLTSRLLKKILLKGRVNEAFANLLVDNAYKIVIVVIVGVGILNQFGIDLKTAITGIGVLGIGLGLAAQDSLSNIISGFLIFFDKPFLVGDYITVGDQYGRVEMITMRSTRIRTQDNTYVVIPNQKIINQVLVDHSTNGDTRLVIHVAIPYTESIQKAREAILKEVSLIDGILRKPEPDVVVELLAESSVKLQVRVWIKNAKREREVFFKTTETVKSALQNAGIEIPYPHMKVIMQKTNS